MNAAFLDPPARIKDIKVIEFIRRRMKPILCFAIIAGAIMISGCRTGADLPQSMQPIGNHDGVTAGIEIVPAAPTGSRASAYYYYAVAQRVLRNDQVKEAIWLLEKAVASDPDSLFLKLELAEILVSDQQEERGLMFVEQVLAHWPDHLPALTLAGKIYDRQKDTKKAKAVFEKAIAAAPQDQTIYILLGRQYWNEDDLVNAQRVFQLMVDTIPATYAGHFFLGKVLAGRGRPDAAIEAFNTALILEPSLEEPRLELIEIYKTRQSQDRVVNLYQDILSYDPENFKATLNLALYEQQIGRSAEAVSLLTQLGQQSLADDRIIGLIFEKLLETKQYSDAVWALDGMLKGAPSSSELHYLAGVAYDGLEQPQATLDHLNQVDAGSRFYPNAVVHRAMLYHNAGQLEPAIAVIEQAILHLPENTDFYYYLASFYEEKERYPDALAVLEKGLSADTENVRIHFKLGVVLDKMGRREESIQTMKNVVRMAPDHADALNYLGYTYAEMGIHLDEAEQLIRLALKNKPENGYITDSMGWVYYKKGEYQKALEWLHKALQMVPDDPAILEHVGDVYLKMNQIEQALSYFHRSLKVNPDNRDTLKDKIHSVRPPSDASHSSIDGPAR